MLSNLSKSVKQTQTKRGYGSSLMRLKSLNCTNAFFREPLPVTDTACKLRYEASNPKIYPQVVRRM